MVGGERGLGRDEGRRKLEEEAVRRSKGKQSKHCLRRRENTKYSGPFGREVVREKDGWDKEKKVRVKEDWEEETTRDMKKERERKRG